VVLSEGYLLLHSREAWREVGSELILNEYHIHDSIFLEGSDRMSFANYGPRRKHASETYCGAEFTEAAQGQLHWLKP
jgi:hypothetical protein